MQLTRAADYALRVMVHLAGLPPDTRVNRSELAAAAECPDQFMSKVLQHLIRAKLLISHRGNVGGFELTTKGRHATILKVVEVIEGPIHLNVCVFSERACRRKPRCPVHPVWREAQTALTDVLRSVTISDLADHARAMAAESEPLTELKWS